MELVYSLGETYLWVGSLCIVQDDADSKHDQISHMAIIYSSALLTIVAASARDASSNLPGLRPGTRWPREKQKEYELNRPLRPDLVLKAIDRTIYVSRAWTFQERHLSRRCLYFLDEQIYFQCRAELWCEEPSIALLSRFIPTAPPEIGLSIMPKAQAWGKSIRERDWDRGFGFYAEIIQEYSWKRLTYPEDVMNAFSGMLSALEQHTGWSFTHNLPEELIDWALLWIPAGHHQRRPPPQSGPLLQFPSWSWTGWLGPITFNLAFGYALDILFSLLKEVEVEFVEENTSTLRNSHRIITGKNESGGHSTFEFAKSPPVPKIVHLVPEASGSTLRFTTMVISAAHFRTEELQPWEWDPEATSDKRARASQSGVLVTLNDEVAGCFLGVSADFLRHYRWSHLQLLAISRTEVSWLMEGMKMLARSGSSILVEYQDRNASKSSHDIVFNVMLVQKRGRFHERVAVGRIFRNSWNKFNPVEETIQLV